MPSAIAISACVLLFVRPRIGSADDATLTNDGALELTTDTARDGGFEEALALGLGLEYGLSVVAPNGAVADGGAAADELDELTVQPLKLLLELQTYRHDKHLYLRLSVVLMKHQQLHYPPRLQFHVLTTLKMKMNHQ